MSAPPAQPWHEGCYCYRDAEAVAARAAGLLVRCGGGLPCMCVGVPGDTSFAAAAALTSDAASPDLLPPDWDPAHDPLLPAASHKRPRPPAPACHCPCAPLHAAAAAKQRKCCGGACTCPPAACRCPQYALPTAFRCCPDPADLVADTVAAGLSLADSHPAPPHPACCPRPAPDTHHLLQHPHPLPTAPLPHPPALPPPAPCCAGTPPVPPAALAQLYAGPPPPPPKPPSGASVHAAASPAPDTAPPVSRDCAREAPVLAERPVQDVAEPCASAASARAKPPSRARGRGRARARALSFPQGSASSSVTASSSTAASVPASSEGRSRAFACNTCSSTFFFKQNRDRHINEVHLGHRPHKCEFPGCQSAFKNRSGLKQHARTVHEKARPFKCELCSAAFGQRNHLTQHVLVVHDKVKQYQCHLCDMTFSNVGNRTQHIKRRHAEKAGQPNSVATAAVQPNGPASET